MVRGMPKTSDQETAPSTHFGFQEIPETEKAARVRSVFESVAGRYDLMNDLMSGGIHRLWKGAMIDWLAPRPGMRLLDVAGGTGDIAARVLERVGAGKAGPIVVCDLTLDMLQAGRARAIDRGLVGAACPNGLYWVCGDAQRLPLPARGMDAYTIAFGLRNVTRIDAALDEARRVLKPGGRLLCLEFSRVVLPALAPLYDLYSFKVLPALGSTVAGDREAYRYLAESIRRFPAQEELSDLLRAAGFVQVSYRNLSGGIAALHSAWRI